MDSLSDGEKHVLTHALTGSHNTAPYRNYFAADKGHYNAAELESLVAKGFMVAGDPYPYASKDGGHYYHCTAAGAAAVGLVLPP